MKYQTQEELFANLFEPSKRKNDELDNRKVFTTTSIAIVLAVNIALIFSFII
jgi:hypothetical protein